jgi:hypothetical protein
MDTRVGREAIRTSRVILSICNCISSRWVKQVEWTKHPNAIGRAMHAG